MKAAHPPARGLLMQIHRTAYISALLQLAVDAGSRASVSLLAAKGSWNSAHTRCNYTGETEAHSFAYWFDDHLDSAELLDFTSAMLGVSRPHRPTVP